MTVMKDDSVTSLFCTLQQTAIEFACLLHTHTHAHTHARTHAHTHTGTQASLRRRTDRENCRISEEEAQANGRSHCHLHWCWQRWLRDWRSGRLSATERQRGREAERQRDAPVGYINPVRVHALADESQLLEVTTSFVAKVLMTREV